MRPSRYFGRAPIAALPQLNTNAVGPNDCSLRDLLVRAKSKDQLVSAPAKALLLARITIRLIDSP